MYKVFTFSFDGYLTLPTIVEKSNDLGCWNIKTK